MFNFAKLHSMTVHFDLHLKQLIPGLCDAKSDTDYLSVSPTSIHQEAIIGPFHQIAGAVEDTVPNATMSMRTTQEYCGNLF